MSLQAWIVRAGSLRVGILPYLLLHAVLIGVTWVVVALMAPAIEVVVPTGCGSIDCSLQTVLMP
jgi:hypothetical protein